MFILWLCATANILCVLSQFSEVQVLAGHEEWIRGLDFTVDGGLIIKNFSLHHISVLASKWDSSDLVIELLRS